MSNTSSKVHDQLIAFGITPHSIHRNLPVEKLVEQSIDCLLYTSPSPRDATLSRMPSYA